MTKSTGKPEEAYVWMRLQQHGIVPYLPMVDIRGSDAVVETPSGRLVKLQVKSRGSSLPEKGSFGEQIKGLWWEPGVKVAFDYLVIVLPKEGDSQNYEAWVVPEKEVRRRLSLKGGDVTMSVRLMREEWKEYHENWDMTGPMGAPVASLPKPASPAG